MTMQGVADPLRALGGTRRAYVVPALKVLYISTAKNACTSLKWLMAELAGEDLSRFKPERGPFLNDEEGIHRRDRFEKTPKLNEISAATRRLITPDNGWFVFSVVRDPRVRLFSAWQNKYLMHNPGYRHRRAEPWYPPTPESAEDVIESFARFVDLIDKDPDHPVTHDSHFMTQMQLLRKDVVPYSNVYEIGELSKTFLIDLKEHLRAQGCTREMALRRTNETPLRATADVFAGPVREQIERYAEEDFKEFGHLWDFAEIEAEPGWTPAMIDDLRARIALGERIGQLLVDLRRANKQLAQANQDLAQAQRLNSGPPKRLRGRAWLANIKARLHGG